MDKTNTFSDERNKTNASTRPLIILVYGRNKKSEFQTVVRFLDTLDSRITNTFYVESVAFDAEYIAEQTLHPDLVVVLQSHPDEFDENDVEYLIAQHPLARLVCCYGRWCESLQRTREAWPLMCCVPARNALERIQQDLRAIIGERKPLPLTASRTESFDYHAA